jgi:hypothetical protein
MKTIKTLLATVCCLCAMNRVAAYDFSAVNNGQTIYYNITSSTSPLTVAVTHGDQKWYSYQGNVVVPDTVSYNGNTYTVTAIGDEAFKLCPALTSITIPHSVTTIRKNAFIMCYHLTSVTIPHSVAVIGESAFEACYGLTSMTVGSSVTTIDKGAFASCRSLTSITIPHSVATIGNGAFAYCTSLTEIHVKTTTPPQIDANTFEEVPADISVYVCGKVEDYKTANNWKNFTHILPDNDCD